MSRRLPVCLLVIALLSACAKQAPVASLRYGIPLDPPRPIAPFQLTDQSGQRFSNEQLTGHWTLLLIGFTHCPDACPMTLGELKGAELRLGDNLNHQVVMVSVDPQRDTPQVLKEYLGWFDRQWIGLTGTEIELTRLLDSLGLAYVKVPLNQSGDYTVDHSTTVMLIDPRGRQQGYWKTPLDSQQLAADLSALPVP